MSRTNALAGYNSVGAGWKTYNIIKKKTMDRPGTMGMVLSLGIAFFVVFLAALFLNWLYRTMLAA